MMPGVLSNGIPQYGFVKSIVHLREYDFDRERGLKNVVEPADKPAILDKPSSPTHAALEAASSRTHLPTCLAAHSTLEITREQDGMTIDIMA